GNFFVARRSGRETGALKVSQSPCGTGCACSGGCDCVCAGCAGADGTAGADAGGTVASPAAGTGAGGTSAISPRSCCATPGCDVRVTCQAMNRVMAKNAIASHLV